MDLPASYYGELDERNPVILSFKREINSFKTLMRQAVSSSSNDDNSAYARGTKILVEIWKKYKHRLPSKFYQEHQLQIADFLFGIKLFQSALWQGYGLHLLQFSTVKITDIKDVGHFMACFFPEGLDKDHDVFNMKVRAMQGCVLCIFELEKQNSILNQEGLAKLLRLLDFLRIMMQCFQQHEHLFQHIYTGSLHIYTICHYLMTMKHSAQALEYLLWASISLELSIPLMTAKYLPLIVTLYCAVCHCYYDNHANAQAQKFANRARGKICDLSKLEDQSDIPATRETQRAYKEAFIKLDAMIFKRAVFQPRRNSGLLGMKTKKTLKDIPHVPWPRTPTEHMLVNTFDCSAGHFLGILEALWDSMTRPLQMKVPETPELLEVVLELLSAGIFILSGATSTEIQKSDDHPYLSPVVLIPTSTLLDFALTGQNKVPVLSAVRFIKLLFHYKQLDMFTKLAREMMQVLSGLEGQSFRKAKLELALLDSFNILQGNRENNMHDDRHKSSFCMNDDLTGLVDTLHKYVCCSDLETQPSKDLVLDIVLYLWGKIKAMLKRDHLHTTGFPHSLEKMDHYDKWVWCLSILCEVALSCDLVVVDCVMTVEMFHTLGILLESTAESFDQTHMSVYEGDCDSVRTGSLTVLESSTTELLQKVCEVAIKGLDALEKGVATLLPQDCSAVTDSAFMQKFSPLSSTDEVGNEEDGMNLKEKKDNKGRYTQSSGMFLLVKDLHLELQIIFHRASLKLLHLNAVAEPELLNRIKKNKVSKALFLTQKALMMYKNVEQNDSSTTKRLLEEASNLIEKAEMEERKVYTMSFIHKTPESSDKGLKVQNETPPPPPILRSRTDHSLTFAPAPYNLEAEVCWYQLCGRVAEAANQKVHLRDCTLSGTGNMVPAVSGECLLRVDGLEPNQKYVFAVAAYNSQGKLLGNTIGGTTLPLLASMPVQLLYTWAHLAQVAFQTEQYMIAKKACKELWSHYTTSESTLSPGLRKKMLQHSSPQLCQMFFTSVFIETEINIYQLSLCCDSFGPNGPFIWEQESRMAECKRMLVIMDFAKCLNNGSIAMQAVITCYSLLVPLIFHQITWDPVVQVLKRCLKVLEENSGLLKQKWNKNTSESLMHMVACITYYLSKALRVQRRHEMAGEAMDSGRRLLQQIYDAHTEHSKIADRVTAKGGMKISVELKALHGKKSITFEGAVTTDNEMSWPLAACDDPTILYDLISSSTLKDAYQDVLKLKKKSFFIEFAALLLQRTMEEGQLELVLNWGQSIFQVLGRRDRAVGLNTKCIEGSSTNRRRGSAQTQKGNESPLNKNAPDEIRKKLKEKLPNSMLKRFPTNREMRFVENMLTMITSLVQHHKKRLRLRNLCCVERVWRSHINYIVALAHLAQLYQGLDKLYGGTPQHRYSQFNPLYFSLGCSGVLVWRNLQEQQSPKSKVFLEKDSLHSGDKDYTTSRHKARNKREVVQVDDSVTEESCEEGEESSQTVEQHLDTQRSHAVPQQDSLNKAALLLRRAMVLAHRGSHWTMLQCVCQTVWDQNCRIRALVQSTAQGEAPLLPIPVDQLDTVFTPLLVLATDLIMDMLTKLGLWSLYDSDLTEEEFESSLQFSVPLDDNTQVDLRWVRTLVLHTLELLHNNSKWETLAHFCLLFNSYTRERYTLIVTPLLVHAQRKLLEQLSSFGGPAVPQPHHVKTQKVTGNKVTCRSYASCQLLSGWTPHPAHQPTKKARLIDITPQEAMKLKGLEMQLSMSLICVPLDVEDTLSCYHEALEKRPHCLHVFQHSRTLLLLLLAYTQPGFVRHVPYCPSRGLSQSQPSLVDFSPIVKLSPNIQPCDLTEEDYSSPNAIYGLPISPDYIPTVATAYSISIKYLRANGHDSLKVLALHEMGNLHFYNGNRRSAQSCWSKAVDWALQCSAALEKWDGKSFRDSSSQQILKQAGLWGCLQAAVLTAKIAQYVFIDISHRTKCCLFSAYLFKCLLCCCMAHPHDDMQYATYIIEDELLPGVDLFSEPYRLHLSTTVMSLNFICHWLFTTGYYIQLLPILAIYLNFVGTVCRDVQRTVEGKILKIRALTELCLFTEAVNETILLTQGAGVLLPHGHYITKIGLQYVRTFYCNKPLVNNIEVLEELLKCDLPSEICTLYGPTLCIKFSLTRIQLILAFANTVNGRPLPDPDEGEASARVSSCVGSSEPHDEDRPDTKCSNIKPKSPIFSTEKENLTPERIKFILLEEASILLDSNSQQHSSNPCNKMENLELTVESNLLKANLHLQQGHAALSCETAVSSLVLLQTSPLIVAGSVPNSQKHDAKDCNVSNIPYEDCPRAVEAFERIGVSLWLRCRLALVQSLSAHIHGATVLFPGKNTNEEAAHVLQEGLDECSLWGDLDVQALLLVEGADLDAQRGRTDDSMTKLQEAVSLLSGRTYMPSGSILTLARATLLLSELKGAQSITLLKLTEKLLKKQLCAFGQSNNIYLPYLNMLQQITERIGYSLDHGTKENLVSVQTSQSSSGKRSPQSSQSKRDSQAVPSLNKENISSTA